MCICQLSASLLPAPWPTSAACPLLSMQRLPGHRDACLTCVALVDEEEGKGGLTSRLFSGGLDGALLEWDVEQRQAGPAADSLGGAVWQLAPEPNACIKPGVQPVSWVTEIAFLPISVSLLLGSCNSCSISSQ